VAEIDAWHFRMRKAGLREPTIHNNHAFLRAVFQQAARWEWITHTPVAAATLRCPKAEPRGVMSPEEVQAASSTGSARAGRPTLVTDQQSWQSAA
jgi:hypothetical protein